MRFLLQRAASRGRSPQNQATDNRFVSTFNRGRLVSGSAGVNTTAPGGLAILTVLIVTNAISVCLERWDARRPAPGSSREFPSFFAAAAPGRELRLGLKLLLVGAVAAVFSACTVTALRAHVVTALLIEWMVFACVACLLE